jgi:hypothetical protein
MLHPKVNYDTTAPAILLQPRGNGLLQYNSFILTQQANA